ncbi:conserved exported hypothetical protein [Rubrivivax sp. A210]|uniref:hypothetical protein n=1 Tax=Rubrivivax sp. A210 TaxID=2772301 RepID=UPI00191A68A8|nr:hypothetical protein [Rubrivivax sp. A210]CAD5372544.1 conserved exported hypothetical protein [Rubrivivax sp. A210]
MRLRRLGRLAAALLSGAAALFLAAPAAAQVPAWSLEAQRRLTAGAGTNIARDLAERQRLAQLGEERLAAADVEGAQAAFDRAAAMVHSADIELGLVRSYMQAGDYRRALTFVSHTAGAHRQVPGGTALYVWLLEIGGQGVVARRFLRDALERWPEDGALLAAKALLDGPQALPEGVLMAPPLRAAPYAAPADDLPAGARVAGTALLMGDGRLALVPAATLAGVRAGPSGTGRVWLRNALGATVAATVSPLPDTPALALLHLAAPLPALPTLPTPPRPPFAGSPAYTVEYSAAADGTAAWPRLRLGFLGRPLAAAGDRLLGIDLPPGPRGGPVFDAQGRLAGLAVPGGDGRDRLVDPEALARAAGLPLPPVGEALPGGERAAVDSVYEVGMRLALQVLVAP